MTLVVQKVAMKMCVFPIQFMVPTNLSVLLNSASIIVKYNQILYSYFGDQGSRLQIFINKHTKIMCSFYQNVRIVQIEESSLSGKTHTCTI